MPTAVEVLAVLRERCDQKLSEAGDGAHSRILNQFHSLRDLVLEYGLPKEGNRVCKHLGVPIGSVNVEHRGNVNVTAGAFNE